MQERNHMPCAGEKGLSSAEAAERLKKYGKNRLKEEGEQSYARLFMEQLNDPLIFILLAAAGVSLFLKEAGDAVIILTVIVVNACVGVIQEGKARKAMEALKKLTTDHALVIRDGRRQEIPAEDLVPGDLVCLEAGRQVPADVRLVRTMSLKVEEAALTGESLPADKDADYIPGEHDHPGDRKNMAYMSSGVTYGRGEGIVTATGMDTEIGHIAGLISERGEEMTPLQKRLADLGKLLSGAAIAICIFLFAAAVLQNRDVGDMLLTAISLAVAAVPEGLPAIVTIVLALSVSRMVKVNTIIRRLPSVETLGAVDVVCSDKTGTLTQNRMTVKQCYVNGRLYPAERLQMEEAGLLLEGCVLCNDAMRGDSGEERLGDPTELALLDLGALYGLTRGELEKTAPRMDEKAFDSGRKMMTTLHRSSRGGISYTKGSTEAVLACCSHLWLHGRQQPMTEVLRREILQTAGELAGEALRVLAVAVRMEARIPEEQGLVFAGLVGMMDPPRPEAAEAVREFRRAGVDTVMITGDHVDTAFAVAKELGITDSRSACITGGELEKMEEAEFLQRAGEFRVYARVSPEHKVRIVETLKKQGKTVAMLGDGVNDAPSLKAADIGVAMGMNGTDVAKHAADMILTDDNFATVRKAIEEGRGIYENIRKAILFLLSSNFGEIMMMLAAILSGLPSPLKASHILWINLITDSLPALALGVDENDGRQLMRQAPRGKEENLFAHGGLTCTLLYGMVIAAISTAAFLQVPYEMLISRGIPLSFRNMESVLQLPELLNKAQTHAFTVLAFSQLFHAIGMRDVNRSVLRMNPFSNRYMVFAGTVGMALQILVTEIPYFVSLFGTARLSLQEWGRLLLLSAVPLFVHELIVLLPEDRKKGTVGQETAAAVQHT